MLLKEKTYIGDTGEKIGRDLELYERNQREGEDDIGTKCY
jgi:hypothetical protein